MSAPERPRVLVPLTIHFAIRYVVRTGLLDRLRTFCHPVLALSWDEPDLVAELAAEGVEVVRLPEAPLDPSVRGALAELEVAFHQRLASPSTDIDRRRQHVDRPLSVRVRRRLAAERQRRRARAPGAEARARQVLDDRLDHRPELAATRAWLTDLGVDAVLSVTPFAIQELVLLRATRDLGLPAATSILSFDNLTTRPPLPTTFDRYIVWNRYNRDEVLRTHPTVGADAVAVTGPAQFDFYADPSWVEPAETWRARVGLAPGERSILYGAGPLSVAPHEDQYVDDLVAALEDGRLPADVRVVLRRHPTDPPGRWERFASSPVVRSDDPGPVGTTDLRPGQADMGRHQVVDLCSALAHTEVHVNVSSTMTLDGACFDKPQIGPAYDRRGRRRHRRRAIDLYRREHFLPIVASGGLELSRRPEELIEQVASALADPGRLAAERRAMVAAICTQVDGHATERVADEVARFLDDAGLADPTPDR